MAAFLSLSKINGMIQCLIDLQDRKVLGLTSNPRIIEEQILLRHSLTVGERAKGQAD